MKKSGVFLDDLELECYYKRNGKFFYRHPITKQKIFTQKQNGTGIYDLNFNVPQVIDKTLTLQPRRVV